MQLDFYVMLLGPELKLILTVQFLKPTGAQCFLI